VAGAVEAGAEPADEAGAADGLVVGEDPPEPPPDEPELLGGDDDEVVEPGAPVRALEEANEPREMGAALVWKPRTAARPAAVAPRTRGARLIAGA